MIVGFQTNYFDKAVATTQGSFTKDIRDTYLNNSLEGFLGNLNLNLNFYKQPKKYSFL